VPTPSAVPALGPDQSRLPLVAAIAVGLLAVVVVLLARRNSDED
jgi:hypothetical protein